MRVMVIIKATRKSEAGAPPSEQLLTDMTKFNEALVKASVMLSGDGLRPSKEAKRVTFPASGEQGTIIDGPFTEIKEVIAGYWVWQVKSMAEALEWVRKCPHPMPGEDTHIEIRPLYEAEDFAEGGRMEPEARR